MAGRTACIAPCVVDEDVDSAPPIDRGSHHLPHRGLIGDVGGDGVGLGPELCSDFVDNRGAGVGIEFGDHNPCALPREDPGDSPPDPVASSRDYRHSILQATHPSAPQQKYSLA